MVHKRKAKPKARKLEVWVDEKWKEDDGTQYVGTLARPDGFYKEFSMKIKNGEIVWMPDVTSAILTQAEAKLIAKRLAKGDY